jgi:hypothetical protein
VELFEEIRREHAHGAGTIRAVAKKLGVHRRMVRQALASAIPPERKLAVRFLRRSYRESERTAMTGSLCQPRWSPAGRRK